MYDTLVIPLKLEVDAFFSISDDGNISVTLDYNDENHTNFIINIDQLLEQEINFNTVGYGKEMKQKDKDEVIKKYLFLERNLKKAVQKYSNKIDRMKIYETN